MALHVPCVIFQRSNLRDLCDMSTLVVERTNTEMAQGSLYVLLWCMQGGGMFVGYPHSTELLHENKMTKFDLIY